MPRKTPVKKRTDTRRAFGAPRRLPSGRWQARYTGPDLQMHRAPYTFDTKDSAVAWLDSERKSIDRGDWTSPADRERSAIEAAAAAAREAEHRNAIRFGTYAERVISTKAKANGEPLAWRTRESYHYLLREHLTDFHDVPVTDITETMVTDWYQSVSGVRPIGKQNPGKLRQVAEVPTARIRAYEVLRMVLNRAVREHLIDRPPCTLEKIRVAPVHETVVISPAEIEKLANAMPPELALTVHLAAWCGLRRSEIFELRRRDLTAECTTVSVSRKVQRRGRQTVIDRPKSGSTGKVVIPRHVRPLVEQHLTDHVGPAANSLLFPDPETGEAYREYGYRKHWRAATAAIGRPALRPHELRATAATLALIAGATFTEVQARLRHKTPDAALRYQRQLDGRDEQVAELLSQLAEGST